MRSTPGTRLSALGSKASEAFDRVVLSVILAIAIMTAGCGKHYLNQYDFADKTLAIVFIEPPAPRLLHGFDYIDTRDNAMQAVVRAGSGVAKEVVARRATTRLDSASAQVDIETLLAARTGERVSRYLGTRNVATVGSADFVLEINMKSFGIDARSNNATYLYMRAETVLLDRRTGREIWSEDVRGSDRLTLHFVGSRSVPSALITAATLHTITVQDYADALDQLMTLTSNVITNELREKLRDVRDR